MSVKFELLYDAYEMQATADGVELFESTVYVNKKTGETRTTTSEALFGSDIDCFEGDFEECDDYWKIIESDDWIEMPHKKELRLNSRLAFRFTKEVMPGAVDLVYSFFHKRGAYSRFKSFLEKKELLEAWYEYEKQATITALKEWAQALNIELAE